MFSVKIFCLLALCLAQTSARRYTEWYRLESDATDGFWGWWGPEKMCDPGQYVYGYSLKSETDQKGGDDTALNGVKLSCGYPPSILPYYRLPQPRIKTIQSSEGGWGEWRNDARCPGSSRDPVVGSKNPVVGFRMQIEGQQGTGDDTAANNLKLVCQSGAEIQAYAATSWGIWTNTLKCRSGYAVVGIQTRVERDQGNGDDTSLNGVRLVCGPYYED